MSWKWMWMALPLAGALAADRPAVPARLSLDEALSIALHNSTALRRAQAQALQAEGQAGQSVSALLPQIGISAAEALQTTNPKAMGIDVPILPSRVGPFQSVDARVNLSQNLFNAPVRERARAGREMWNAALAQRDNARELLAYQVQASFAQGVRAQAAVASLARQVELSDKLLATARDRFAGGVASALEVKRSEQQVNNLRQSLDEARNQLTAAKLALANLMGAEVTSAYELEPQPSNETPPPAQADALAAAKASRADYRAARAQVEAATHRLAAAKAERYPSLQFQAGYGQSGRKPFENVNTFLIRGVLQVPVFTGGRIKGEQVEAQGRLEEAQAVLDEIEAQVEMEVLAALSAEDSARKQVASARANVGLANEEVELAEARFTSGAADNTEVVNAQDRLSRAEDNLVRAQFALSVAGAQLARATGSAEKMQGAAR